MGAGDGVVALLAGPAQLERAFVTAARGTPDCTQPILSLERVGSTCGVWRESVRPDRFVRTFGSPETCQVCKRLGADDVERLSALYSLGGGDAFSPTQ